MFTKKTCQHTRHILGLHAFFVNVKQCFSLQKRFHNSVSAVFINCRLTESFFKYFDKLLQSGNILWKPGCIYSHLFRYMAVAGADGLNSQFCRIFISFFIGFIGGASV